MAAAAETEKSPLEKKWLAMVEDGKGDTMGMKTFLEENPSFNVDLVDMNGMTALQHASFRGNEELCQILLDHGADVNSDKHENKYTALMFGALSGNENVVNMLLDAGARVEVRNSVNRTAGEMAAFVAQHHIGGVIMNFYPSKKLQRFTKTTGKDSKPKLKPDLLKPFHSFISSCNLHPIYLVRELHKTPELLTESKNLIAILNELSAASTPPPDGKEAQSFKFHYLSCVIDYTKKADKNDSGKSFIKRLATGRSSDGLLDQVDQLVRSTFTSYPQKGSSVFCELLKRMNENEIGSGPSAVAMLTDAINGNRVKAAEAQVCHVCGSRQPKQCKRCRLAFYCTSNNCQKLHWPTHKKFCKELEALGEI